jgi:GTP-binding protein
LNNFYDRTTITVTAGNGGDGAVSFHREKYVPAGGPDGGDGGSGGSVILLPDNNLSTLVDSRYKRVYTAPKGENGSGRQKSGRDGANLTLRVPVGTVVKDKATGGVIHDLSDGLPFVLARGGRGGRGNKRFATATRQAPRFAKPGGFGQSREVTLELKLLADVGLIGLPNAGKSTLLAASTRANPKIADYPFTTLHPNLGVANISDGVSFVLADVPGLIENASEGAGLGHGFLRHIERCRLLIHVIAADEPDVMRANFDTICGELKNYDTELAKKPMIVALNKSDLLPEGDTELFSELTDYAGKSGFPIVALVQISGATGYNVRELLRLAAHQLSQIPAAPYFEADFVPADDFSETAAELSYSGADGEYTVTGPWLDRLLDRVNLDDTEGRAYFDTTLRRVGVYDRLIELGLQAGDTIIFYNWQFVYN